MPKNVILGISCFNHDAAASLIVDDQLIAMAEEERFNGQKHTAAVPIKAMHYCLDEAGLTPKDVQEIVFYFNPWLCLLQYLLKNNPLSLLYDFGRWHRKRFWFEAVWLTKFWINILYLPRTLGCSSAKLHYANHSWCHILYGFFCAKEDSPIVLSNDSIGENTGAHAVVGHLTTNPDGTRSLGDLKTLIKQSDPHSIGYLYGAITQHLGFKRGHGEGKVMALSSFETETNLQKPLDTFFQNHVLLRRKGTFSFSRQLMLERSFSPAAERLSKKALAILGDKRISSDSIDRKHYAISKALQNATNALVDHQVDYLKKIREIREIVHVGGVAQNSVSNGFISCKHNDISFNVPPIPHDAGCAIGAALSGYYNRKKSLPPFKETAFLGGKISTTRVKEKLVLYGISNKITVLQNEKEAINAVVKDLCEGKVIALFNDRMECGPRALGNRSILADPRCMNMKDNLNTKIKFRELFRPYGGVCMAKYASNLFEGMPTRDISKYMTHVLTVKKSMQNKIPALVHVDKTCRVQLVSADMLPFIDKILLQFYKKTGVPMLVNTSFNVRGEPICRTVEDALSAFYTSGIDSLMFNFAVKVEK